MNDALKYDPEDIESLLLHKAFSELYPEEKAFVLRHIDGREEYESLRKTLNELRELSSYDEWIEPDTALKQDLLATFARERRKGFRIWLNTLFAAPAQPWYRRPTIQLAFGGAILLLGIALFLRNDQQSTSENFAELKKTEKKENDSTYTKNETQPENTGQETFPPAPEVVASASPTLQVQSSGNTTAMAENTFKASSADPVMTNEAPEEKNTAATFMMKSMASEDVIMSEETLSATDKDAQPVPSESAALGNVDQLIGLLYTAR